MIIAGSRVTGNTAPNDKAGNPGIGAGVGNFLSRHVPDNCEPVGSIPGCTG